MFISLFILSKKKTRSGVAVATVWMCDWTWADNTTLCTACQHANNGVHLFHHMILLSAVYIQICCHAVLTITHKYIECLNLFAEAISVKQQRPHKAASPPLAWVGGSLEKLSLSVMNAGEGQGFDLEEG